MCEIPTPIDEGPVICADANEATDPANVSLNEAATALASGRHSTFALDRSDPNACPGGLPRKVLYLGGEFPDGFHLCVNCGTQIPVPYASPAKACIAKCRELMDVQYGNTMKGIDKDAHCEANARTATNFDKTVAKLGTMCFDGACSLGGTPDMAFFDPRRLADPVQWVDKIGTSDDPATGSLTRTLATTPMFDWNAGAASDQLIIGGDAWIEFHAAQTDMAHLIGVRESRLANDDPCLNINLCHDMDPSNNDAGYALNMYSDGTVYVVESSPVLGTVFTHDSYGVGQRFRVKVADHHDGTATISYAVMLGSCVPGQVCSEFEFYTSTTRPRYPLRVNASFRQQGAGLVDVTIMQIKQ